MKSLCVILPATDETNSLAETVRLSKQLLSNYAVTYIIVTSPKLTTPACRQTIASLQHAYGPILTTFDQKRPGPGGAVRDALERVHAEYLVMMPSDLEVDPAILPQLVGKLDEGYDMSTATRWRGGSRFVGYHPLKLALNFMFQQFFRVLYMTTLSDLTYGYRAYKREAVRNIKWQETGFPFFIEHLLKPLRLGLRITEVDAPWRARTEGVSHASVSELLGYVRAGLQIRLLPRRELCYSALDAKHS